MPITDLTGAHLSPLQERLWVWSRESNIYDGTCAVWIKGPLHIATFQHTLQQMIEMHEILHTLFYILPGMEYPVQVISQSPQSYCPMINLVNIPNALQEDVLTKAFDLLKQEPFDLAFGPLLRTILYCIAPETHLLLFSLPALCADAATLQRFGVELFQRYEALHYKQTISEEPLQYIDVVAWQKDLLEAEKAKASYEFWSRVDLAQIQQMSLPLNRREEYGPKNVQCAGFAAELIAVTLDKAVSVRLGDLKQRYGVSYAAFLLACWQVLLWRLTGDAEQIVGVAGDGRIYEELKDVIGPYTRFIPIHLCLTQTQTFAQVLTLVSQLLEQALPLQSYFSWPTIQNTQASGNVAGYFPVTFEYEDWPEAFCSGSLTVSLSRRFTCIEPFVLKLSVLCSGDLLQFEIHYDTQHFTSEQAHRLASMLDTFLRDMVERPDTPIRALRIVEPFEQARLLNMFQAPHRPCTARGLQQLFEEHARRTPNWLALLSSGEQLTYQQLNDRADRLARVLRHRGVAPNVLVGLYLPRSIQMIVGVLAIFKAGGAYVPLDTDSPQERLVYQLQDARPTFLLTQQALASHLPPWGGESLCIEELWSEVTQVDSGNLPLLCQLDDLAYVIYTSGSTGVPKGVLVSQRNILNYTQAMCDLFHVEPGWQFATVSTLAADLGNTAIFCALASGGTLHVLDYATVTSAESFAGWVGQHPIDVLKIVPSHLSALLAEKSLKEMLPRRALVLGGEALPVALVQQIQNLDPDCTVYNHYGPTETTIGVLVNKLANWQSCQAGRANEQEFSSIPLGEPIAGTDVYVLDPWMQVVPEGVIGELYIGGCGLANGYLHQPEQTAERFVPHPWSRKGGTRLYRTGDLVRYEQGHIEFVGREDSQVKVRGYRVEPGEIEIVLKRHPLVRDSVVMLREDEQGSTSLVGYIMARKQPGPTNKALRDFLRAYVPEYMVPSTFVFLKVLPLTANGKLDRRRLTLYTDESDQLASRVDSDQEANELIQPLDRVEFKLLRIWEEILPVQPISIVDNFFDLGGHSILAVRLMSQIFRQFGQDLALATLFQHPTIADLAVVLRQRKGDEDQSTLVAIQEQGTRPPFFCIHPSGGTVFCYVNLARYLGQDQPFYGLQAADMSITGNALTSLEELASYYITSIQSVQPQGPYLLGGWSLGGIVAFEIAQQLYRQGHEVALLAIIDSMFADPRKRSEVLEEKKVDYTDEEIIKEEMHNYNISVPDDFEQFNIEQKKDYILEKAKEMYLVPPDFVFEQIRPIFRRSKTYSRLAHAYIPRQYPQRVTYFQAAMIREQSTEASEGATPAPMPDRLRMWREVAQGDLEIHSVTSNHGTMMEEPHVRMLAVDLKQCIDRVCGAILVQKL